MMEAANGSDKSRLGRGVSKVLKTLPALAIAVGLVINGADIVNFVEQKLFGHLLPPSDDELEKSLTAAETPAFGRASTILGFGDSEGGRPSYVYGPKNSYPRDKVVVNSLADVQYTKDERSFVDVRYLDSVQDEASTRRYAPYVDGRNHSYFGVHFVLDNNSNNQADCTVLQGPTVAQDVRIRLAVSSLQNGRQTIRIWVIWRNSLDSNQHWITASAVIDLQPGKTLILEPSESSEYRQTPYYLAPMPAAGDALISGGMKILDGSLGACWENRTYGVFIFGTTTGS